MAPIFWMPKWATRYCGQLLRNSTTGSPLLDAQGLQPRREGIAGAVELGLAEGAAVPDAGRVVAALARVACAGTRAGAAAGGRAGWSSVSMASLSRDSGRLPGPHGASTILPMGITLATPPQTCASPAAGHGPAARRPLRAPTCSASASCRRRRSCSPRRATPTPPWRRSCARWASPSPSSTTTSATSRRSSRRCRGARRSTASPRSTSPTTIRAARARRSMAGIEGLIRATVAHHPVRLLPVPRAAGVPARVQAAQKKLAHHFYDKLCPLLEEARRDGDLDFTRDQDHRAGRLQPAGLSLQLVPPRRPPLARPGGGRAHAARHGACSGLRTDASPTAPIHGDNHDPPETSHAALRLARRSPPPRCSPPARPRPSRPPTRSPTSIRSRARSPTSAS